MKKLLLLFFISVNTICLGQSRQPRVFLFVPGAFDGGWDYSKVDAILRTRGEIVYRPTLTGLGERVNSSNANINLSTYIADIVNLIKFENLHNIILVGHSYAGMVISGVAEQMPDRIKELVYLDAMVPNDGESAEELAKAGGLWDMMMKPNIKGDFIVPPYPPTPNPPYDVPQPLKTFTEPIKISNPLVKKIPAVFIAMTKDGAVSPVIDKMGISRARSRNWKIYTLEGGHYAMREQPENLVNKLESVIGEN
ncbi:alpha/beta fold hydrolase [Chitinophaga silvisoli]|uniref:Alpha/beta fold hydrolase n=1 Tax=Chitinophaga silvisoli TaxID=2291814 RepID=A0A3E1NXA4_9BACT|nr:alpha/beta fold hydrolase [Chitinophaga silvisoli]RFM32559.1 alpha/beta fold hydrolase [Chitinophaga silvisoli]